MCNNHEDFDVPYIPERAERQIQEVKSCCKCGATDCELYVRRQRQDALCGHCFCDDIDHRFRQCIGKARVRDVSRVALSVNGQLSSCALIQLMKTWRREWKGAGQPPEINVIFINDKHLEQALDDGVNQVEDFKDWLSQYNDEFPLTISQLECLIADSMMECTAEATQQLKSLMLLLSASNDTEELLSILRLRLLLQTSQALKCSTLVLSSCGTSLTSKVFTGMAEGRGVQIPYLTGAVSTINNIQVIHPFKKISDKELKLYCNLKNMKPFYSVQKKESSLNSITSVTEEFLKSLEISFPASESNILSTGEKVQGTGGGFDCPVCLLPNAKSMDDLCHGCERLDNNSYFLLSRLFMKTSIT